MGDKGAGKIMAFFFLTVDVDFVIANFYLFFQILDSVDFAIIKIGILQFRWASLSLTCDAAIVKASFLLSLEFLSLSRVLLSLIDLFIILDVDTNKLDKIRINRNRNGPNTLRIDKNIDRRFGWLTQIPRTFDAENKRKGSLSWRSSEV